MSFILLYQGGRSVARLPLVGRSLLIGASPAMDFTLPDNDLPAKVCSFEPIGLLDYRLVSDIEEGILIDGVPKHSMRLYGGETLQVADYDIVFHRAPLEEADWEAPEPAACEERCTGTLSLEGQKETIRSHNLRIHLKGQSDNDFSEISSHGLRIGASEANDLVLDDSFCSGLHAFIFWENHRLFIQDLESTNGTLVNGVSVSKTELKSGFQITVGATEMEVVAHEQTLKVPALKGDGPWQLGEMKTCNREFAKTLRLIEKIAVFDATVCIFGESGTGKELVAQAIHQSSARSAQPFIAINCAAIPKHLIESQLFGHEKGAFTGADKQVTGAFEQAQNGTLFLDEIGELPFEMQAKLLRVLENMQIRRVGGKKDINLNFRLITATHRDLPSEVAEGRFREDLLHRLYVLPVELMPLRERPEDILFLAKVFLQILSPKGQAFTLAKDAQKKLMRHPFKGNVRELKNLIQRAVLFSDSGTLCEEHLFFVPTHLQKSPAQMLSYQPGMTMEDIERMAYGSALKVHRSAAAAATALGVPKTTFWRRAKQLDVLGHPH